MDSTTTEAGTTDAMDAIDLLITDHNRVRGLFHQLKQAIDDGDVEAMALLGATAAAELDVHAAIEEEIFYPFAKPLTEEIADSVNEGVEEHHEVKVLLAELADLEAGDDVWKAKWTVVMENISHHAGEEEEDLFPKTRGASTADERRAIGARLDARKGALGQPTLADRVDLTVAEVRELARDQEIPGRSKMDSDELRATVAPT